VYSPARRIYIYIYIYIYTYLSIQHSIRIYFRSFLQLCGHLSWGAQLCLAANDAVHSPARRVYKDVYLYVYLNNMYTPFPFAALCRQLVLGCAILSRGQRFCPLSGASHLHRCASTYISIQHIISMHTLPPFAALCGQHVLGRAILSGGQRQRPLSGASRRRRRRCHRGIRLVLSPDASIPRPSVRR